MSLAHSPWQAHDESMTHHHDPKPSCSFSASAFRDAMGPGYSIALYKEGRLPTELISPVLTECSLHEA